MSIDIEHADDHAPAKSGSIALCLSGGGFRSALFHLGALRRLNELGVLSQVNLISSVSGGSILAAHLATQVHPWPKEGEAFPHWDQLELSFRSFVRNNIRNWPVLKRYLFPWNWLRPSTQVWALEKIYRQKLTSLKLTDLPEKPIFVFCATDMVNGVSWVFERKRVGSYKAGYLIPVPDWQVSQAVAASSCFPPIFDPMPITTPANVKIQKGPADGFDGMSINDGGLYDNLGLQPADKFENVLVSDGGAPFIAAVPHGLFGRLKAYLRVSGKQAGSLRKRFLMMQFTKKEKCGTYWGIGSAPESYQKKPIETEVDGYSKDLAIRRIATIRTDLDPFSEAEVAVLINHGYTLADIAVHTHFKDVIRIDAPSTVPFPDWMDEAKVEQALRHSDKRFAIVRWYHRRFRDRKVPS